MSDATHALENEAARAELAKLVNRLDAATCAFEVSPGWTIATTLCHLAFWDQRALFLLRQWQVSDIVEAPKLDPLSVNSINHAVNEIARHVPATGAMKLALDSAEAVDAFVAGIDAELAEKIRAAGHERYLRRSLHRREHLQKLSSLIPPRQKD